MSETIPPQQQEFDPLAEAQAHTDYDQRANFQRQWLGLGEGATPEQVAQAARDTVAYHEGRPAEASQTPQEADNALYSQTQGKSDREKPMMELVHEQAQAEINSDRTRANDIQEELNARVILSGTSRDPKYDAIAMPAIERDAHRMNTLFNQKQKMKANLNPEAGAPDADEPEPTPAPAPQPHSPEPETPEPEPEAPANPEGNNPTSDNPETPTPNNDDTQEIPVVPPTPAPRTPRQPQSGATGRRSTDPRYPMRGFDTWTEKDLQRGQAAARGEKVAPQKGRLENNYFDILQDLPRKPDAIQLLYDIADFNRSMIDGKSPSKKTVDSINQLYEELEVSHPGLAERLLEVYRVGTRFENEDAKISGLDVKFIDLMSDYKGLERNQETRRRFKRLYDLVNEHEGSVPVNWRRDADGIITSIEGSREIPKGDWLIGRHKGARLGKEFNFLKQGLAAEGTEIGRASSRKARLLQNVGRVAAAPITLPVSGVRALANRRSRQNEGNNNEATDPYANLNFNGSNPEATAARREAVQAEIDRNREVANTHVFGVGNAPGAETTTAAPAAPEAAAPTRRQRIASALGSFASRLGLGAAEAPTPEQPAPGVGETPTRPMTPEEIADFEARLNQENRQA